MIHHLRAAGVSALIDTRGTGVPRILHWGADLGPLPKAELELVALARTPAVAASSIDTPLFLSVFPHLAEGWSGLPAISIDGDSDARISATVALYSDTVLDTTVIWGPAEIVTRWELSPEGVLTVSSVVTNDSPDPVRMGALGVALPVPDRAREVLDFSGRWAAEREPQRHRPPHGAWLRETRHGRGGHDDPFLMLAGTADFGFRSGEVWGVHLAWSGDKRLWYERSDLGLTVLGAGELCDPITLAPGESHVAPTVFAYWSGDGLDGLSSRSHAWVRAHHSPRVPRPLTLNTWEAVYFDHELERLHELVDAAAGVGVERFVLDDGWYTGRTDDRRALGDWTVDAVRWPHGLTPLTDRVLSHGMSFGIWVEPEMVSLDSDLARQHPHWLLTRPEATTWRHQHVLNLGRPDVRDFLFDALDRVLTEYPVSFVKWDHNRDLLVRQTREQVLGVYDLIDRLRHAHPDIEIESCASGGARVDLEMARHVHRFWTSDTNDPLVRQRIQRWTGLLLPPEYLGAHVGDARSHTTGRTSSLSFRLATALFLHAGIESDLTRLAPADREALTRWAQLYRERRDLLHSGTVVRADVADSQIFIHGIVSGDRSEALYAYAVLGHTDAAVPPPVALPGLDPDGQYQVASVDAGERPLTIADAPPPWIAQGVVLSGRVLGEGVLAPPLLAPGQAVLLSVTRLDTPTGAAASTTA